MFRHATHTCTVVALPVRVILATFTGLLVALPSFSQTATAGGDAARARAVPLASIASPAHVKNRTALTPSAPRHSLGFPQVTAIHHNELDSS